jgi:hypothetical protein
VGCGGFGAVEVRAGILQVAGDPCNEPFPWAIGNAFLRTWNPGNYPNFPNPTIRGVPPLGSPNDYAQFSGACAGASGTKTYVFRSPGGNETNITITASITYANRSLCGGLQAGGTSLIVPDRTIIVPGAAATEGCAGCLDPNATRGGLTL